MPWPPSPQLRRGQISGPRRRQGFILRGVYDSYESDLVELFEYKVAALRAGQLSKAAQATLRDLREHLLTLPLDSALLRRMRRTDRLWREWQKGGGQAGVGHTAALQGGAVQGGPVQGGPVQGGPVQGDTVQTGAQQAASTPAALSSDFIPVDTPDHDAGLSLFGADFAAELGDFAAPQAAPPIPSSVGSSATASLADQTPAAAQPAQARNEWDILKNLRGALFYFDLHLRAQAQAQAWVLARQQAPLRLALALLQAWQEVYPNALLPTFEGHYADMQQPGNAAQVLGLLTQHLSLPLEQGQQQQQRVRAVLRGVQGASLPGAVLGIKPLKDEQRDQEALQRALHKLLAYSAQDERPVMAAAGSHQPLLAEAAQQLGYFIEKLLPYSLGGRGPELPLLGGLLYARGKAVRIAAPDDTALSLAIHLSGGDMTQWCGTSLRWRRLGDDGWEVVVNDPQGGEDFVRLSSTQPLAESHLAGEALHLALLGDDLALERRPGSHRDLAPLVQEARLCAALLESESHYANLRLARAVAMFLRSGQIVPQKVAPDSAAAYATAPAAELLAFARQGAVTLRNAAQQAQPQQLSEAFAHALVATQVPSETAQALLNLLLADPQALRLPVLEDYGALALTDPQDHRVVLFRGEPLTAKVANQPLTLRQDDQGKLTALVPGRAAVPVGELLALPFARGAVVLVQVGERVVLGFQPKLPHPVGEVAAS